MASGRAIDHVVLTVRDLDAAAITYQRLGFTLTPRAAHNDQMGTSNRLAQFRGRNFIELLEVDRPETLARHEFAASPPFFSFGDHNRSAVREREGLSMLVFASDDARADISSFAAAGLPTFAPFDFERQGQLPDGRKVTVGFSLGFIQSREMPNVAFFVCENRAQDYFWKPEYQSHANGTTGIAVVYLSSPAPERDAAFVAQDVRWRSEFCRRRLQGDVWSLARATCSDSPSDKGTRSLIGVARDEHSGPRRHSFSH
jgi:catechol 2,3-dioxygenase-like lactoylglutathione lyase family enzyme